MVYILNCFMRDHPDHWSFTKCLGHTHTFKLGHFILPLAQTSKKKEWFTKLDYFKIGSHIPVDGAN